MIDLGKEFRGIFSQRAQTDGSCVEPASVEAPSQRAITERHGKTIKFMLRKAMDEFNCENMKDWEDLVDVVGMMKNRLMLKNGFSPIQRDIGYMPRIPGGLLTGDAGNEAFHSQAKMGERGVARAMKIRKAAAKAFMEADCEDALRRAIAAGPRTVCDFDIGEVVYFYRMGANKKLKFDPKYWQGPGRIAMIDQPNTIWIAYQGYLVKAAPENLTLTGWISDIVNTKEQLEQEPKKGYIDLMQEPIPPELLGEEGEDDYEPEQVLDEQQDIDREFLPRHGHQHEPLQSRPPKRRYREKGPQDEEDLEELPQRPTDHNDQGMQQPPQGEKREAADADVQNQQSAKRSRLEYLEI